MPTLSGSSITIFLLFVFINGILTKPKISCNLPNKKIFCKLRPEVPNAVEILRKSKFNFCLCTHIVVGSLKIDKTLKINENTRRLFQNITRMKTKDPFPAIITNLRIKRNFSNTTNEIKKFLNRTQIDGINIEFDNGNLQYVRSSLRGLKSSFPNKTINLIITGQLMNSSESGHFRQISNYVDFIITPPIFFSHSINNKSQEDFRRISDLETLDSVIDDVLSWGVPSGKLLVTLSTFGIRTVLHPNNGTIKLSRKVPYFEVCANKGLGNWTLKRERDQTSPFISKDNLRMAFDDEISIKLKSKYILLRKLAGIQLASIDEDDHNDFCRSGRYPLLQSVYHIFSGTKYNDTKTDNLKEYMEKLDPKKLVKKSGELLPISYHERDHFICTREGYYQNPSDCSKFYRCVKFHQFSDHFTTFHYYCPPGLIFDERYEICNWPSWSDRCSGSGEIINVPRSRFVCPGVGYFRDRENCRWFYFCSETYSDAVPRAYEFKCPYDLAYDEVKHICNWKWLVPGCGIRRESVKWSNPFPSLLSKDIGVVHQKPLDGKDTPINFDIEKMFPYFRMFDFNHGSAKPPLGSSFHTGSDIIGFNPDKEFSKPPLGSSFHTGSDIIGFNPDKEFSKPHLGSSFHVGSDILGFNPEKELSLPNFNLHEEFGKSPHEFNKHSSFFPNSDKYFGAPKYGGHGTYHSGWPYNLEHNKHLPSFPEHKVPDHSYIYHQDSKQHRPLHSFSDHEHKVPDNSYIHHDSKHHRPLHSFSEHLKGSLWNPFGKLKTFLHGLFSLVTAGIPVTLYKDTSGKINPSFGYGKGLEKYDPSIATSFKTPHFPQTHFHEHKHYSTFGIPGNFHEKQWHPPLNIFIINNGNKFEKVAPHLPYQPYYSKDSIIKLPEPDLLPPEKSEKYIKGDKEIILPPPKDPEIPPLEEKPEPEIPPPEIVNPALEEKPDLEERPEIINPPLEQKPEPEIPPPEKIAKQVYFGGKDIEIPPKPEVDCDDDDDDDIPPPINNGKYDGRYRDENDKLRPRPGPDIGSPFNGEFVNYNNRGKDIPRQPYFKPELEPEIIPPSVKSEKHYKDYKYIPDQQGPPNPVKFYNNGYRDSRYRDLSDQPLPKPEPDITDIPPPPVKPIKYYNYEDRVREIPDQPQIRPESEYVDLPMKSIKYNGDKGILDEPCPEKVLPPVIPPVKSEPDVRDFIPPQKHYNHGYFKPKPDDIPPSIISDKYRLFRPEPDIKDFSPPPKYYNHDSYIPDRPKFNKPDIEDIPPPPIKSEKYRDELPIKPPISEKYISSDNGYPKKEINGIGLDELFPKTACIRPGLFRHPENCNKFYECYWDKWINKFTLHMFDCPIKLVFDEKILGCSSKSIKVPCTDYRK